MQKIEQEMIDAWYNRHKASIRKPYESYSYSKRFYLSDNEDDYWYIVCSVYEPLLKDWVAVDGRWYEFSTQFEKNGRSINIETVSRFSDPEEKYRPYPTLVEVEEQLKKLYNAYMED